MILALSISALNYIPLKKLHSMNIYKSDISVVINEFKSKSNPNDRYTSFDYCYGYFLKNKGSDLVNNMEYSCLSLGFYLASWGMLRGSSFLLEKSVKHYQPTIEYISTLKKDTWDIDVDSYCDENYEIIMDIYNNLKDTLEIKNHAHLTIITKVMLGVFGIIPAFDDYFVKSMKNIFGSRSGFSSVSIKSLNNIKEFYSANEIAINDIAKDTFLTNFDTGQRTTLNYPKAKIIDMYGFTFGYQL